MTKEQPDGAGAGAVVVRFEPALKRQSLVKPPQTHRLHAGKVILEPGESVGEHSTDEYEELLCFRSGTGEVECGPEPPLAVSEGSAVYIPPQRLHNVKNTGTAALEYIYIVTKTTQD